MIFPTGWQQPRNNNGLEKMNKPEIKEDCQIIKIINLHNAFPGVAGAEWTNVVLWEDSYNNELDGKQNIITEGKSEVKKIISDKSEIEKPDEIKELAKKIISSPGFKSIKEITTTRKPYGLATDAYKNFEKYGLPPMQENKIKPNDITIYQTSTKKLYVPADYPFPRTSKNLKRYKVLVPDAWGNLSNAGLGGAYADIIIASPYEATLGTYIESGGFDDFNTAKKHAKYLMTKFYRAALYMNKNSIINSTAYGAVPLQSYQEEWWNQSISEIDNNLMKKYNIPENISLYVMNNIQTKTEANIVNFDGDK